LTDAAQKRLRTILEASELGAGFRIAMKDLEIRGAGNLLGSEQSGHMGAVGFDLYNRLLSEAVAGIRSGGAPRAEPPTATVDLPLEAYIPEIHVPDLGTRLGIYTRLAGTSSIEGLSEVEAETRDRFGTPPAPVKNLFYLVRVKLKAGRAGIQEISFVEGQVVIRLASGVRVDRSLLQQDLGDRLKVGTNQLRLDIRRTGKAWTKSLERVLDLVAQTAVAAPVGEG
jgi:transcription-repair coupling factor (superfamily II helicase)